MSSNNFAGGKPEKNPSVSVWLKYNDEKLYEAIDDQGIIAQLRPRFGSSLTFMYPADKSYRDNIIEKLNGSDATVGVNMVQALIIVRENLAEPADWLERKDNIPNALGQKVELSPDSTNKQVILANGATLSINKSFVSRDNNISVWDYKGPEMPLNGKPAEFVKRPPKPIKFKKSGGSGFPVFPSKCILAKRLEDQTLCLLRSGDRENFQNANPFTASMVSLVQYLKSKPDALKKFNLMCEPNSVATFYAVLMPYTVGSLLEAEVESWLRDTRGVCLESNINSTWVEHVKSLENIGHEFHEELLEAKDRMSGAAIKSVGESLYKNKFGDQFWMHRLKGDEFRFLINTAMSKKSLSEADMSQLFLDLKILYSPLASGSFFLVGNSRTDPVFLSTVSVFVASRCFMSVPNPQPGDLKVISFYDALNSDQNIDPETHFIHDDEFYLAQTTTSQDADFISGLKKILTSMPADMKSKLLSELSSA